MKHEILQFRRQQKAEGHKIDETVVKGGKGTQELRRQEYSIVNTSSVAGLVGAEAQSGYGASKHAVIGISKAAAVAHVEATPK